MGGDFRGWVVVVVVVVLVVLGVGLEKRRDLREVSREVARVLMRDAAS